MSKTNTPKPLQEGVALSRMTGFGEPPRPQADLSIPIEDYRPERIAEFLLNNAVDEQDYRDARREVITRYRIDPDTIDHDAPVATSKE